jgi:hypothetical protein
MTQLCSIAKNQYSRRNLLKHFFTVNFALYGSTIVSHAAAFPMIAAYRNPGCGCCEKWVEHLRAAGFAVTMEDDDNLAIRKDELGIPMDLRSCHTGIIGDYVLEGHIPAEDIILFLAENTDARGLAVAEMPMGSPGMETDGIADTYDVFAFKTDGSRKVYSHHGP